MGVMDTEGKQYLSNPVFFADAFNYLLYDGEQVIMATDHEKIDPETAVFLNRAVNLQLEYEDEPGGVDMCKAMEKRDQRQKITGVIQGMQLMGASENDIISKIVETYHVTKEYVLALLAPKQA